MIDSFAGAAEGRMVSVVKLSDDSDAYLRVRVEAIGSDGNHAKLKVSGDGSLALVQRTLDAATTEFLGEAKPDVTVLSCTMDESANGWVAIALLRTSIGASTMVRSALALSNCEEQGCKLVCIVEAVAPLLASVAVKPHALEDSLLHELLSK